ncbi:MAG: adenosylmethionine--8-amino-7-oxononanoate transaminase [Gammaproteobacteria bacterium]
MPQNSTDIGAALSFDRRHIWHPYTSAVDPDPVYFIESAAGVMLKTADGRELIDGMASWWSVIHGYNHPRLNRAVQDQLLKMAHVMFGGLTHAPAVELARRLLQMAPAGLDSVFFSDSGSVAVEVALKMALQYWQALGAPKKNRFLALQGGYHGDTFGAMAVCDPVTGMHHLFNGVLTRHFFAPRPASRFGGEFDTNDIVGFERMLSANADEIAAVILEPIVQGAGGMWFYHADFLAEVRSLCHRHGILLIADEIATAFGRTGRLFACEHAGITPDILCVGKALTGGYMTLAATLATDEIGTTLSGGEAGCFMHGPTFMANPLACSVASESIDILLESDWRGSVAAIEQGLKAGLEPCRDLPGVADVRVLGAIGVVETEAPLAVADIQARLVEQGVWLRPFGRLLYTMPAYSMTAEQVASLTKAVYSVLVTPNKTTAT